MGKLAIADLGEPRLIEYLNTVKPHCISRPAKHHCMRTLAAAVAGLAPISAQDTSVGKKFMVKVR